MLILHREVPEWHLIFENAERIWERRLKNGADRSGLGKGTRHKVAPDEELGANGRGIDRSMPGRVLSQNN